MNFVSVFFIFILILAGHQHTQDTKIRELSNELAKLKERLEEDDR